MFICLSSIDLSQTACGFFVSVRNSSRTRTVRNLHKPGSVWVFAQIPNVQFPIWLLLEHKCKLTPFSSFKTTILKEDWKNAMVNELFQPFQRVVLIKDVCVSWSTVGVASPLGLILDRVTLMSPLFLFHSLLPLSKHFSHTRSPLFPSILKFFLLLLCF